MKRILITSLKGDLSGVPIYTKTIATQLNDKFEFIIVTADSNNLFKNLEDLNNVTIVEVDFNNSFSPVNFLKALFTLKRIIKNYAPDIMHLQGTLFGVLGRLVKHQRIIYTYHGIPFDTGIPFLKRVIFFTIEKALSFKKSIENIALTEFNKESLINVGYKNSIIIENFSRITPPIKLDFSNRKTKSIISVGGFRSQKNYNYLFKLFNKLPKDFNLTIAGTNTDSVEFKNLAKSLVSKNKISKINFLGSITNISDELQKHEIFIQTSIYEGFSLAAIEARAFGLKLALSNTSGTKEIIRGYNSSIILDLEIVLDSIKIQDLVNLDYVHDYSLRNPFTQQKFIKKINELYEK